MTDRTDIRLFKEGEIVISEGRTNKEMYKIVSGKAAVYFDYKKSSEYLVGVLGDTRCFGEIGLLTGKPSPFTVVAVTDLMLLSIGEDDFELFVSDEPRNAVDIMRNLAMMVFTMGFNVNMLKDELTRTIDEKTDAERVEAINRSILKYRVSGLLGSPYFSDLS